MRQVTPEQITDRLRAENPWWETGTVGSPEAGYPRRAHFEPFFPLVRSRDVRRAVVLMGPRRVGKTVLLHHVIEALLRLGTPPSSICYVSIDNPIYNGLSLADLLEHYRNAAAPEAPSFVFFDEIQYLKDWEVHLKALVDAHPDLKCVASGSAAAALRLRSLESGAGRFTDFLLPPVNFYEYLLLLGNDDLVDTETRHRDTGAYLTDDVEELNRQFIRYLNFGGYPEAIFHEAVREDPARFIKGDIIDKVLLRDLPQLYGIQDIQELNYLFSTLAFNTANEVSLEGLSKNSGVSKNTIRKYIEYLEAAFLVRIVHRVDRNAKRFQRARTFKVYLTNPSMRTALFAPVGPDDDVTPDLVETSAYAQWIDARIDLHYARWPSGEVDLVALGEGQKPVWAVEVKWSDRYAERPGRLKSLLSFARQNGLRHVLATSRTRMASSEEGGVRVSVVPASQYCFTVGHDLLREGVAEWSPDAQLPLFPGA